MGLRLSRRTFLKAATATATDSYAARTIPAWAATDKGSVAGWAAKDRESAPHRVAARPAREIVHL